MRLLFSIAILFSLAVIASGLGLVAVQAQSTPETTEPPFYPSECDDMPRETLEEKIEKRECRVAEAQRGVDYAPPSRVSLWIDELEKRQAGLDRLLAKQLEATELVTDTTAPTLTAVSIASNNPNDTTLAITGDTVTLRFLASENILTPTVTFNGDVVDTVTRSGDIWSATKIIASTDSEGLVAFDIQYIDLANNVGVPFTLTTDNTDVTVDNTRPTPEPVTPTPEPVTPTPEPVTPTPEPVTPEQTMPQDMLNGFEGILRQLEFFTNQLTNEMESSEPMTMPTTVYQDMHTGINKVTMQLDALRNQMERLHKINLNATNSDFDLDTDNGIPSGITFLDNRFWVTHFENDMVYAYNIADGTRDAVSDFRLASDNAQPIGITALNGKLWVLDADEYVFAYDQDGTYTPSYDFDLFERISSYDNPRSTGITSLDDKFYIVKSTRSDHGRAIDTYNADGTKATNSSISVGVAYRNPTGIASLDGDLFVVSTFSGNSYHYSGDKVYAYSATYGHDPSINGFTLHKLDILPIAITSLDDKFYVISAADAKVYVYNTDGTRPLQ